MALSASKSCWWWALGASLALHLALTEAAPSEASRRADVVQPRSMSRDRWAGTTFDVDAILESKPTETEQIGRAAPAESPEPKADLQPPPEPPTTAAPAKAVGAQPEPKPKSPSPETVATRLETHPSAPRQPESTDGGARKHAEKDQVAQAQSPNETPGDAGAAASGGDAQNGTFGASGEASGTRDLAKAFTRALPRATSSDSIWERLPIGYLARVFARLETNAEGHVVASDAWIDNDAAAPALELQRMVRRGVGLLGTGQFALPDGVAAGSQTLRIDVQLKQGSRSDGLSSEPQDTVELGFDPPRLDHPGRAFFRKASGRTLEMRVAIVSK